ncbi:MAG: hypothetical protein WCG79_03890 [Verrucomicrobiota bacterium]
MRQWFWMALLTGSTLWVGCGKSQDGAVAGNHTTNQTALVELEPWELRAKELTAAVKPGMTEDEVIAVAGDPKMVRTAFGGKTGDTWQYELGSGNWFNVQFNKNKRVDGAGLEGLVKPQN